MNIILTRDPYRPECTLGVLAVGEVQYQTMERPQANSDHVCVPEGEYQLVRHDTPHHPKTWALVNQSLGVVHHADPLHPEWRSEILIHPANRVSELLGCIAPGMSRSYISGEWMVTQSVRAFTAIQAVMAWIDGHSLTIRSS